MLQELTNKDTVGDFHYYEVNVKGYLAFVKRMHETHHGASYVINDALVLDEPSLKEFALSFLRAYQLRMFYELYRDLNVLPPNVSPSKLKGAFDLRVPEWMLNAVRELLRPMYHNGHVYIPAIVQVTEALVGRAVDNSDRVITTVTRNLQTIGRTTAPLNTLGIHIRPGFFQAMSSTFRGHEFVQIHGQEALEAAPLSFLLIKKETNTVDDPNNPFTPGGKHSWVFSDPSMMEARVNAVRLLPPFVLVRPANDDVANITALLTEAIAWRAIPGFAPAWWMLEAYVLSSCFIQTGSDLSPIVFPTLFFNSLTNSFKDWDFPSLGAIKPTTLPTFPSQGPNEANRSRRARRKRQHRTPRVMDREPGTEIDREQAVYEGNQEVRRG